MRKGMRLENFRQIRNYRGQATNYDSGSPLILDLKWKEIQKTISNDILLNKERGISQDKTLKQVKTQNEKIINHSKSYR